MDIRSSADHISQEIMRVRGLPERIATLTHEKLEPVLKARESHTHFEEGFHRGTGAIVPIEPFIATPDGKILAGRYKRSERSEAWLLPYDAADIVAWVSAALAEWHGLAPDRFPGVPDWSAKPEWMTPEERLISAEIADVENQRQATLARLSQLDRDLRTRLTDAKEKADRYERALLTTQSEELKQAVIKALTEIGFSVTDADEAAAADDHLEDIHVADPDQEGWIALGEVKGYVRGARTEGLTQFLRFNMRYAVRTGSNPSACWYIVNQFLARDPSTRQPALHGKDEDVHAFGQGNGLVIDTVDLFKLISRVRDGVLTAGEARKLLRESTGKFRL
ncbi:hypothetical protein ACH5AL_06065 [Actinacidiphila glaucinigra]|uniref:hypothetical protein n=1 Tax=Actinacidiphila glaucinigra TaxID=235986 RepID=UPI0037B3E6D8